MSVTGTIENANLIAEFWASEFYPELRANLPKANFFSRDYEGELRLGDIIRVNQINKATGEIITDDKQEYNTETMSSTQYTITVDKRASAAFEFTDLAQLQSNDFRDAARDALVYGVTKQIEDTVAAALVPSTSSPDHDIAPASASDLASADVGNMRQLLSSQSVPVANRALFLAPSYYSDLLNKTQVTSSDFIPAGSPTATGAITFPVFGFTVVEDQSLSADVGYGAHRSALQIVMQQGLRMKVSDLHSNKKYGYVMSADMVFGLTLFDNTRLVKISG